MLNVAGIRIRRFVVARIVADAASVTVWTLAVVEGCPIEKLWFAAEEIVAVTTRKALLVPLSEPAVLVAVIVKVPVLEIVTLCDASTPAVKAAVVPPPAESVPVEVMLTVPVKLVTVL